EAACAATRSAAAGAGAEAEAEAPEAEAPIDLLWGLCKAFRGTPYPRRTRRRDFLAMVHGFGHVPIPKSYWRQVAESRHSGTGVRASRYGGASQRTSARCRNAE